jgi:hypothetical protein
MKRAAVVIALVALAPLAHAHDFNPGVLSLVETSEGRFQMAWTPPVDSTGSELPVDIDFPAACRRAQSIVDCGSGGLAGAIGFSHLDSPRLKVVVHIRWLDGSEIEELVDGRDPSLAVERRPHRTLLPWIRLGVEHILTGADHLAFVLGMLLVLDLTLDRRLLATITAFTAAHSLSLALAALDIVRLPSAPVEAAIAASVVLVAYEALHPDRRTATRRWPWLVAGLFGLVHGLGFAGALARIGLPHGAVGVSLLGFNLGVEIGQVAVVAAAVGLARVARLRGGSVLERDRRAGRAQRGMAYVLGSLGMAWFLARAAQLLGA